ncbi:phage tail-fiber asembly protein [Salmonella enterica subsp. indica]|uniref:Phage tail-fiber asembly protein n=1 Tax=Salmonella enterica subsp. indica TaxID=59207 RepID=A0A379XTL5_SALER|nr:phage tail-fiber asembly protein [Salmonella enterica subsp. indica]
MNVSHYFLMILQKSCTTLKGLSGVSLINQSRNVETHMLYQCCGRLICLLREIDAADCPDDCRGDGSWLYRDGKVLPVPVDYQG